MTSKRDECRFEVGDQVTAKRWDKTEPPARRLGLCIVVGIFPFRSQSGWMVRVESLATTEQVTLDQDWIEPI